MDFAQQLMIVTAKGMTQEQIIDTLCKVCSEFKKNPTEINKNQVMFFAMCLSVHNSIKDKTVDQAVEEIKEIMQIQTFFAKN